MRGTPKPGTPPKVLAVAAGGGHWVQLLRLRPAFEGCDMVYLSTNPGYAAQVDAPLLTVTDASMWEKLKLLKMFLQVASIVRKVRPAFVVTTGAAPGFAAIFFGKLFGAKTLWLDSMANAEELSGSGKKARRWADAWLTQWPELAGPAGPTYWGSVL